MSRHGSMVGPGCLQSGEGLILALKGLTGYLHLSLWSQILVFLQKPHPLVERVTSLGLMPDAV